MHVSDVLERCCDYGALGQGGAPTTATKLGQICSYIVKNPTRQGRTFRCTAALISRLGIVEV